MATLSEGSALESATLEPATAPFGSLFADRMTIAWFRRGSWTAVETQATQPLQLHPSAHVLHYSSTCIEGLKAHRWEDGTVRIFRLDQHIDRMQKSAELLCLPVPGAELLEEMICDLAATCRDAVPSPPGSLYLRPTLIGTLPNVGAAAVGSNEACLFVLASPVGDYFEGGLRPLRIFIEDQAMRTPPDFGAAKTGGSYASALRHVVRAKQRYKADQVLFCPDGDVQETGAANFMLLNDRQILTKPTDESFLPGVTRQSVLELAAGMGYDICERDFTVQELLDWLPDGEAALTGTAAVIAAVGTFIHGGQEHRAGNGGVGPNTRILRRALTDIQSGRAPDTFGWLRQV